MSTEQVTQSVSDAEMKQLLSAPTDVDDDNKLVTRADLEKAADPEPPKSLWADADRLARLQKEMSALAKVRIPTEPLPEGVVLKAMAEVLADLGWVDYRAFSSTISKILRGPPKSVPFAMKTRNQRTGKMDFWLIRVFINVGETNKEYVVDDKRYNKRDVLMSRQFCDFLRDYCRTQLKDEAQFWTFTGTYRNKQHLDMGKLNEDDLAALRQIGETDPNNLVMIQFKKKTPEVMVGKGLKSEVGA